MCQPIGREVLNSKENSAQSVKTKHPEKNIRRHKDQGQNVQRDKTSGGTKHLDRQYVRQTKCPWDKTSVGTKRPGGKNVQSISLFRLFDNSV
jgi:hypothetical protein